jgi:hypothetical protein
MKVGIMAEQDEHNTPVFSTTTDALGNFVLQGPEPGAYRIRARRNGYPEAFFGTRLSLEAGQKLKELKIRLQPFGVVAGVVRDADGEPIPGADGRLFLHVRRNGRQVTEESEGIRMDYPGQYSFHDLKPGRYGLRVDPPSPSDSRSMVDRSLVSEVPQASSRWVAGARVPGIDLTPLEAPRYHLRVHLDFPAGLSPRVHPEYPIPALGQPFFRTVSTGPQDFEFRGVPPGSYIFVATAAELEKTAFPRAFGRATRTFFGQG